VILEKYEFLKSQLDSLSAKGFVDVFISIRIGVPAKLKALRKRPSRKRL
jgi:NADPH-dependent glutamate synthase beta subunit-like oxidoreductase